MQDNVKNLVVVKDSKRDFEKNELVGFRLDHEDLWVMPNQSNFPKGGFWVKVNTDNDVPSQNPSLRLLEIFDQARRYDKVRTHHSSNKAAGPE